MKYQPMGQIKQNLTKMIHIKKYHLNLQWLHPSQMDVVTKNINSENGKNGFVLSLNQLKFELLMFNILGYIFFNMINSRIVVILLNMQISLYFHKNTFTMFTNILNSLKSCTPKHTCLGWSFGDPLSKLCLMIMTLFN